MTECRLLWDCFLSEQMDFLQLRNHIADDPSFANFVTDEVCGLKNLAPTNQKLDTQNA
jgi:hypothetical protein